MKGDISRHTFRSEKHYSGVRQQQGRVLLDADWNEQIDIQTHLDRTTRRDVVGACGVPAASDGFKIDAVDPRSDTPSSGSDLSISPGRIYVDGVLCESHAGFVPVLFIHEDPATKRIEANDLVELPSLAQDGRDFEVGEWVELSLEINPAGEPRERKLIEVRNKARQLRLCTPVNEKAFHNPDNRPRLRRIATYLTQPDYPHAAEHDKSGANGTYLAYLDVWQRHITPVEEPSIREAALGGPDTTTRTKTIWQVKLFPVDSGIHCESALDAWTKHVAPSTGKLSARTKPVEPTKDACILPPGAGYSGLEHQTYRVEIHDGSDSDNGPTFKWSRDNGSLVYIIEEFIFTATNQVRVAHLGRDEHTGLHEGDWVEILDDNHELAGKPGVLARIDKIVREERIITLQGAVLSGFERNGHPKLRRWDMTGDQVPQALPAPNNDGYVPLEKGVQVKFTDGTYRTGDYWIIPARSAASGATEADIEWPRDAAGNPVLQSPLGITHHYCRLAIVQKTAGEWHRLEDCRKIFPPLTELELGPSKLTSCCNVTVGDGETSLGDFDSIQEAIDHLARVCGDKGGKVCVLPGEYREIVVIDDRRNVTLCGCGRRTVLRPAQEGVEAVIRIVRSQHIRIENLQVTVHAKGATGILLEGDFGQYDFGDSAKNNANVTLANLSLTTADRSAIQVNGGQWIAVQDCRIETRNVEGDYPAVFVTADDVLVAGNIITVNTDDSANPSATLRHAPGGLQIGGTSERVRIIDNRIEGGTGSGITLGSFRKIKDSKRAGCILQDVLPRAVDLHSSSERRPCWGRRVPDPVVINEVETRYESAGNLYDVAVEHNRILKMGLNGIDVAGYFDTQKNPELITVEGLRIVGNEIAGCLASDLPPVEFDLFGSLSYGAIALANVEDYLIVRANTVEKNGQDAGQPVCGLFVLLAEGIDISGNRITENGPSSAEPALAKRGGIYVNACLPAYESFDSVFGDRLYRQNGIPALKVHDNIVTVPLGRALTVRAYGPVSVQGNHFTSRGVVQKVNAPSFWASTVFILNLGVTKELFSWLLLRFSALLDRRFVAAVQTPTRMKGISNSAGPARETVGPLILADGNVLFTDNQCTLDLRGGGLEFSLASIVILTLDDIGFHDNQCDCSLWIDLMLANTILLGPSLRVSDNRFKENLVFVVWSLISLGFLNTTTGNQSTHCVLVRGFRPENVQPKSSDWSGEINEHNTVLLAMNPEYQSFCAQIGGEDPRTNVSKGGNA